MIKLQSIKLGFGIALSLGLCACMDMQRSEQMHMHDQGYEKMNTQAQQQTTNKPKAQKTYASKDPAQRSTPGPKRNAAPQIPVIE
ncbi:hypothetical protein [Legionella tucsonensis]|uniref:Lipoprotein n=1 Tax=Legionella tucsonensis TaxID=40335 RepID=A0A0W0ZUA5_9GAMM|nr:hypothetical protein [Legionella tucsonensis]KTD72355.1 hypothetical protein Ltuc_0202 [Legionella tucsonensis]